MATLSASSVTNLGGHITVQNGFEKVDYDDISWPQVTVVGDYGSAPWSHVNVPSLTLAGGDFDTKRGNSSKIVQSVPKTKLPLLNPSPQPTPSGAVHNNSGGTLTANATFASKATLSPGNKQEEEPQTRTPLLGVILNLVGSILRPTPGQQVDKSSASPSTPIPTPSPSKTQALSFSASIASSSKSHRIPTETAAGPQSGTSHRFLHQ
ncbi:hypothetical protein CPB84DRAFT_1339980 [Gymnopilus junonius]|uniref:Uncharacterized protein n=1 Tax=Gymnopilus junonius TaxID=109634 RepID=A0A9P5NKC0_GYMJU|nr:hypothetical protein CPB84DRAFT_1339980 [Gymnopilus junonius]